MKWRFIANLTRADGRDLDRLPAQLIRAADVAPVPSVFGVGRMWQAFTELSDYPSQVAIFRDLPAALEWLGLKALPASIKPEPELVEAIGDDGKES